MKYWLVQDYDSQPQGIIVTPSDWDEEKAKEEWIDYLLKLGRPLHIGGSDCDQCTLIELPCQFNPDCTGYQPPSTRRSIGGTDFEDA